MSNFKANNVPVYVDKIPVFKVSSGDFPAQVLNEIAVQAFGYFSRCQSLVTNPSAAAASQVFQIPSWVPSANQAAFQVSFRAVRDALATICTNLRTIEATNLTTESI
jgi:hypothetical protein